MPAHPQTAGAAVRPWQLGLRDPQAQHRQVRHREREHRPERVDGPEELRLSGSQRDTSEPGEREDPQVRRAEARVQPPHRVGHLPVQAHRVDEPRHAEDARVGRRDEDRDREDADVELGRHLKRAELHRLDDPEHRVRGVAALFLGHAEQRRAVLPASVAPDGQRRERDPRQREVDSEYGDHHALDGRGDRLRLIARFAGHVRDRLDPRVRDRADRDRDQEVLPGRRGAEEGEVVDQQIRTEDQEQPGDHERELTQEVDHREHDVHGDRILDAANVDQRQQDDQPDSEQDVARRGAEGARWSRRRSSARRRTPRWRS